MYLTEDAITATLRQVAAFAPGSTLAMSFLLPLELADPEVRPGLQQAEKGARASGTPFISFFTPAEMLTLAREAGFREVQHVSAATLAQRYFAGRTDGLRPPNNSEELLVATTQNRNETPSIHYSASSRRAERNDAMNKPTKRSLPVSALVTILAAFAIPAGAEGPVARVPAVQAYSTD